MHKNHEPRDGGTRLPHPFEFTGEYGANGAEAWGSSWLVSYCAGYFAPVLDSVSILPRQAWSRERGIITSTTRDSRIALPLSPLASGHCRKEAQQCTKTANPGIGALASVL
jgi:hypothetical protein